MANKRTSWKASGMVWGNTWGGGKGGYPAKKLSAKTRSDIINQAKRGVDNGSLDSGMGFESLYGAVLFLTKTECVVVKGKEYCNDEYESEVIGNLSEEEIDYSYEQGG